MNTKPTKLSVVDHDRDSAHKRYVYPVVSRRARGVSLGINLNPNNACNYRCIYCQVPDLSFGKGPVIDLALLEQEFSELLDDVLRGDFMERRVEPGSRRLNDVAFSGNGEPTSSPQFSECVELVERVLSEFPTPPELKRIVITNGTLTDRPQVESALRRLANRNGEVWFKLDRATAQGVASVNSNHGDLQQRLERLKRVSEVCPTWIQSCWFKLDGQLPSERERDAFLSMVRQLVAEKTPLKGVLLYGLARPSLQPEASRLAPVEDLWLEGFGKEIQSLGMPVRVSQ